MSSSQMILITSTVYRSQSQNVDECLSKVRTSTITFCLLLLELNVRLACYFLTITNRPAPRVNNVRVFRAYQD
jgi:hypothetical protein